MDVNNRTKGSKAFEMSFIWWPDDQHSAGPCLLNGHIINIFIGWLKYQLLAQLFNTRVKLWLVLWERRNGSLLTLRCPGVWGSGWAGSPQAPGGPTAAAGWEGTAWDTQGRGPPRASEARGRAAASQRSATRSETWKPRRETEINPFIRLGLSEPPVQSWCKQKHHEGTLWRNQHNSYTTIQNWLRVVLEYFTQSTYKTILCNIDCV